MEISIKRAYLPADPSDGYRVLVDRLWPRGIKKEHLKINEWCKEVAPTTQLRKWFSHDPKKFSQFSSKYKSELEKSEIPLELLRRGKNKSITLIYAAKNERINQAIVLKDYLESLAS